MSKLKAIADFYGQEVSHTDGALWVAGAAGVLGDPEVLDNADMAKTNKERQDAFRARKIIMEGMTEVRGLFFPPDRHAELKELAKKLLAETTKPPATPKGDER